MNFKKYFLGLALILLSVVAINYEAAARLVSGVTAHNHSSQNAGGTNLNSIQNFSVNQNGFFTLIGNLTSDIFRIQIDPAGNNWKYDINKTTGQFSSNVPCAAGYTRITPNFCHINTVVNLAALIRDSCTSIASPSANAKALYILGQVQAGSANGAATARFTILEGYDDATCTTILTTVRAEAWEFTATAAQTLDLVQSYFILPRFSASRLKFRDDAGNLGSAAFEVRGYFE